MAVRKAPKKSHYAAHDCQAQVLRTRYSRLSRPTREAEATTGWALGACRCGIGNRSPFPLRDVEQLMSVHR